MNDITEQDKRDYAEVRRIANSGGDVGATIAALGKVRSETCDANLVNSINEIERLCNEDPVGTKADFATAVRSNIELSSAVIGTIEYCCAAEKSRLSQHDFLADIDGFRKPFH